MKITFDFNKPIGKIRPMHAVGQPPFFGDNYSYFSYLEQANIPYSRLHDVGGVYGGGRYVDIPNIFCNFDADENDPMSYDFKFTDSLLLAMAEYNIEPIFRLGVTIENQQYIRAYRIYPPKDNEKWARICEHIIRHYNEGWADGYHMNIKYWEIWNEPDNDMPGKDNQMWKGSKEEFYALYDITAKHLKKCFGDSIKVGGYASCGFIAIFTDPDKYGITKDIEPHYEINDRAKYFLEFFFGFLDYITAHKSPIDFFSWHSYDKVQIVEVVEDFVQRTLEKYGLGDIETQLNEWNNAHFPEERATSYASANAAAMMCMMQNKKTDILCYYDARIGISKYGGLFDPLTFLPTCTYYAFEAFGELYKLGTQTEAVIEDDKNDGVYVLAAKNKDKRAVIFVNISNESKEITTNLPKNMIGYQIDVRHHKMPTHKDSQKFVIEKNGIMLFCEK